jgi:CheY-like chemotaxis protein
LGCAECDHGGPRRRVPVRRARVLIAASDTLTRRLIAISLLLEGFDAVPVTDSQQYLDTLATSPPDVVVLHVNPQRLAAWRAVIDSVRRPGFPRVRVVAIIPAAPAGALPSDAGPSSAGQSGGGSSDLGPSDVGPSDVGPSDLGAAADACLTTPFDPADMIRAVRELSGRPSGQPD